MTGKNIVQTTTYLEKEDYKALKTYLLQEDKTFTQWIRIIVKDYLNKKRQMNEVKK